jgi:PHD/YefM family antitoxin component YafN of YafNO toxin-antitoxin module
MTSFNHPGSIENLTDYERLLRLEELAEMLRSRLDELEAKIDSLGARVDERLSEIYEQLQLEIAQDRRRITVLENHRPAGDVMESRAEVLRSLLIANGGKMLRKDARNRMELSEPQFTYLLNYMKDEVRTKPLGSNKKYTVIYLVDASC